MQYHNSRTEQSFLPLLSMVVVTLMVACSSASSTSGGENVSYTLNFIAGSNYSLYASIAGGPPHQVQLDTGSIGLYVPKRIVGSSAHISTTEPCSITYISSDKTLSGHKATGSVTLLGSTTTGDVQPSPSTVPMSFCAIDDTTFNGGMMGVGFGRGAFSDPTQNALLQIADISAGRMHPGYVLSTHPSPNVQIGITEARSARFQKTKLSPSTSGNGDWIANSLVGCVSLPSTPGFKQECGGLLVDTGVPTMILWGPADPTLDGIVASGKTSVPNGTAMQITTQTDTLLDFSFVLGGGADSPSAVDIRTAKAFSINTGRSLLVDYDYLFDAQDGLVGFQRR